MIPIDLSQRVAGPRFTAVRSLVFGPTDPKASVTQVPG